MKKIVLFMSVALTAIIFSGCASFTVVQGKPLNGQALAPSGKTIAHVEASNWGIYLFHIPLLSGSTENLGDIKVLTDTVTVANMTKLITAESKKLGGKTVLDLVTTSTTDPFFFGIKQIDMSANVIK